MKKLLVLTLLIGGLFANQNLANSQKKVAVVAG